MINFKTIKVGDRVKVVGMGAPGFAEMGEILTVSQTYEHKLYAVRDTGEEAFFALTCGARRLELVTDDG